MSRSKYNTHPPLPPIPLPYQQTTDLDDLDMTVTQGQKELSPWAIIMAEPMRSVSDIKCRLSRMLQFGMLYETHLATTLVIKPIAPINLLIPHNKPNTRHPSDNEGNAPSKISPCGLISVARLTWTSS